MSLSLCGRPPVPCVLFCVVPMHLKAASIMLTSASLVLVFGVGWAAGRPLLCVLFPSRAPSTPLLPCGRPLPRVRHPHAQDPHPRGACLHARPPAPARAPRLFADPLGAGAPPPALAIGPGVAHQLCRLCHLLRAPGGVPPLVALGGGGVAVRGRRLRCLSAGQMRRAAAGAAGAACQPWHSCVHVCAARSGWDTAGWVCVCLGGGMCACTGQLSGRAEHYFYC